MFIICYIPLNLPLIDLFLKFLFLVMKKMKHRIVEHMSSTTADALGLSRAILCNGRVVPQSYLSAEE